MRYRMFPGQNLVLEFPDNEEVTVEYGVDRVIVRHKDTVLFILVFSNTELTEHLTGEQ